MMWKVTEAWVGVVGQRREEDNSQIIRNGVLEHNLSTNSLEMIVDDNSSPLGAETMASIAIAPPIH